MRITLDNFKELVSAKIWHRGEAYFEEGTVTDLEEVSSGEWQAIVEGTYDYQVTVLLDGDEVRDWSCDCPYDGGDICKHVVAVVLAIKERKEEIGSGSSTAIVHNAEIWKESGTSDREIEDLLKVAKEDDLKKFVAEYAYSHPEFKDRLIGFMRERYLYSGHHRDYFKEIGMLFRSAVRRAGRNSRYYGDPDFDMDWSGIAVGIGKMLDEAAMLLKIGNAGMALEVPLDYFAYFEIMSEDELYDLPSFVTDSCEKAGRLLLEAVRSPAVSEERKKSVVGCVAEIACKTPINEYDIYDIGGLLMELKRAVCTTDEMLAFLDGKINETQDSYVICRYVLEKVDLLRSSGRSDEADKFVSRWIALPEVRRHEVERFQKEQRYDEALDMLDDGIKADAEDSFGRYQHEWVEMRLHIHELQGDCQSQIEDCRWLFCNTGGNLDYYHKLKKLVPPSDWKVFLENMMDGMTFSCFGGHSNAADIYVEEKDYPRLFKMVSECGDGFRLDMLSNYAGRFPVEYTRDLFPLFISDLRWYAEKNIGRQYYERIAGILGKIRRLEGGGKVVEELVAEFRDKYSRRRAMMEVLKELKP